MIKHYEINEAGIDHAMRELASIERVWFDMEIKIKKDNGTFDEEDDVFETKYIRAGVLEVLRGRRWDIENGYDEWESGAKLAPHHSYQKTGSGEAIISFDDEHFDITIEGEED